MFDEPIGLKTTFFYGGGFYCPDLFAIMRQTDEFISEIPRPSIRD